MDHDEDDLSVTVGKQRRNGKHNTRKQEAEGRESFNRMSGHVFRGGSTRSCQDIYANRASSRLSFRLYALRFSWRICIRWIDSPFLSRFPSYPLSLSLSLSLFLSLLSFSRPPVVRPFYFYLLLATYTCEYAYEPPRNARQYRPICIRDASLQALSKFPFPPHTNQPLSGRARSFSRWPCLPVEVAWGETEEVACGSTKSIVCAKVTGTLGIKFVYNLG